MNETFFNEECSLFSRSGFIFYWNMNTWKSSLNYVKIMYERGDMKNNVFCLKYIMRTSMNEYKSSLRYVSPRYKSRFSGMWVTVTFNNFEVEILNHLDISTSELQLMTLIYVRNFYVDVSTRRTFLPYSYYSMCSIFYES